MEGRCVCDELMCIDNVVVDQLLQTDATMIE